MSIRTYTRILFNDIFKNAFLTKLFNSIVNFYCDLWFRNTKSIKFDKNMPINKLEKKAKLFFQSVTGDKIDCK